MKDFMLSESQREGWKKAKEEGGFARAKPVVRFKMLGEGLQKLKL
jgi:hypothetical protein